MSAKRVIPIRARCGTSRARVASGAGRLRGRHRHAPAGWARRRAPMRLELAPGVAQVRGVETLGEPVRKSRPGAGARRRVGRSGATGAARLQAAAAPATWSPGCERGSAPRRSRPPRPRPHAARTAASRISPRRRCNSGSQSGQARASVSAIARSASSSAAPARPAMHQHLGQDVGVDREVLGRAGFALDAERLARSWPARPGVGRRRRSSSRDRARPLARWSVKPRSLPKLDHALRQRAGRLGLAPVAAEGDRNVQRVQDWLPAWPSRSLHSSASSWHNRSARSGLAQMPAHGKGRLAAAADPGIVAAEIVGVSAVVALP